MNAIFEKYFIKSRYFYCIVIVQLLLQKMLCQCISSFCLLYSKFNLPEEAKFSVIYINELKSMT